MWLITFLLPLKFGVFAAMPEGGAFFPGDFFSYLVINWAATAFGFLTAPALLLVMAAFPEGFRKESPGLCFAFIWSLGIAAGMLPGLVHISTWDFARLELNHIFSIGCYAMAAWGLCAGSDSRRKHLMTALWLGFLPAVWFGLEQYFWGFRRSREFLEAQIAEGKIVNQVLRARVFDDRVFGTFTSGNSLAGYLLLLAPLMTVWSARIGERFEPARLSRVLFAGITAAGALAVFLMTKSRAGFLALAMTGVLTLLLYPMKRLWRIFFISVILLGIAGSAWYIHARGRGFLSMTARADYLRSSVLLLAENPAAGCGWGEFFFEHVRIKQVRDHEAAHDPHNLLMTCAQSGTGLVLLAIAGLMIPVTVLLKKRKAGWTDMEKAGLFGLAAFYFHAMMDIDFQIPGLMAAYFAVGAYLLTGSANGPELGKWKTMLKMMLCILAAGAFWSSVLELRGEIALERLKETIHPSLLPGEPPPRPAGPEEVDAALLKAVKARPYSSQPWSFSGDYYLMMNELDRAESDYRESLKRSPKRAGIYARLAKIAEKRGDQAAAGRLMEKAHRLFPNNPAYQAQR